MAASAGIIADSLKVGDHVRLDRPFTRGTAGLCYLLFGCFRGDKQVVKPSHFSFVLANGVAHGERLAQSIQTSLPTGATLISDIRLASPALTIGMDFPSLAARSIGRISSFKRVFHAIKLRSKLPRRLEHKSRVYGEYLFLSQAVRFQAAQEILASTSEPIFILTDFDRDAYSAPWVLQANKLGHTTATLVHGTPNTENYLPVLANHVFTWGENQASWFRHHIRERLPGIYIVGRTDINKDGSQKEMLDSRLVICHSREFLSVDEEAKILAEIRAATGRYDAISLRLHPSATIDTLDDPWKRIARSCDSVSIGTDRLVDSLQANDYLIACMSSSAVEAFSLGVRVTIVADDARELPADLESIAQSLKNRSTPDEQQKLRSSIVARFGDEASKELKRVLSELSGR